jgi:hypothetical protein
MDVVYIVVAKKLLFFLAWSHHVTIYYAIVRLEGLGQVKNTVTSLETEPAIFQLIL